MHIHFVIIFFNKERKLTLEMLNIENDKSSELEDFKGNSYHLLAIKIKNLYFKLIKWII